MYKKVTLEMSIKPFKKTDDDYIREVCRKVFTHWRPLVKDCEVVSIMLWTSDGSEILDYAGNEEDSFEWCRFLGTANLPDNTTGDHSISPHTFRYDYMENPPVMTYGVLKRIVKILKEEGKSVLNKDVLVGETFDIGPEFALSDFKYNRHKEICSNSSHVDRLGLVDCTATLRAENRKYASYPLGIPEGEPIGLFLGKQVTAFLTDMGMDFIWLSNGFGFSADPWSLKGKVFDGEKFDGEKLIETRRKVFEFWKQFRTGCPDYPVQVRGTNNSVAIDYATDAVPIYEIYNGGFNITPPPNSPWAALNDDYGLELMGHMTRISELPADEFMFRFYIHDPWWNNSPWYDRYGGEAMDIYMPSAITRINGEGKVEKASIFNILSIDNTWGEMPDACVNEPLPHIIKAQKDAGDAPAPLVWVYPFREYSTALEEEDIKEGFYCDRFIRDAINNSFPLNCVVSTDNFLKTDFSVYKESVLISPAVQSAEVKNKLACFVKEGGRVVFYGSQKALGGVSDIPAPKVDVDGSPENMRRALKDFGYVIEFNRYDDTKKTTTMTVARSNNGFFLSAYNQTTAIDVKLRFPQGIPLFIGSDAIIEDSVGVYRFARSQHSECRFFVQQDGGVVSAREFAPVNKKYRRKIVLYGLKDATVRFYPESYCIGDCIGGPFVPWDGTPVVDQNVKIVKDEKLGVYYEVSGISGEYMFCMPFPEYVKGE